MRAAIAPMVEFQARIRPLDVAPQIDLGYYTRAQQEVADPDDPMEVNTAWRPVQTMAVYAGWLNAILSGHKTVAAGLNIAAPVCVLLSARFVPRPAGRRSSLRPTPFSSSTTSPAQPCGWVPR